MPEPLTRARLDAQGCGMPDCGHDHTVLHLHGRCHPSAGTRAKYDKRTGVLTIACRHCRKLVGEVRVADDDRPTRILLDEAAFCDLVAGQEVERTDLRGHKVLLILSDIGWDRMVDAIAEAMMASELPLGQGRAAPHGPRNGP